MTIYRLCPGFFSSKLLFRVEQKDDIYHVLFLKVSWKSLRIYIACAEAFLREFVEKVGERAKKGMTGEGEGKEGTALTFAQ